MSLSLDIIPKLSLHHHLFSSEMAAGEPKPPAPVIGKVGRYTVFITPKATHPSSPTSSPRHGSTSSPNLSPTPTHSLRATPTLSTKVSPSLTRSTSSSPNLSPTLSPSPAPKCAPVTPVQVPPKQFDSKPPKGSSASVLGFFWHAVAKVQNAHSSLDECLADWFGLDQSKYQWALNDYYESKGLGKEGGKQKEKPGQAV